jgi:hypothetical protein
MLLGRERNLLARPTSQSKDKNRALLRVASSSKLPKDFFKNDTPHTPHTLPSRKNADMLEFTFMKPMPPTIHLSAKPLKKCAHLKSKPSIQITHSRNSQSFTQFE